MSAELGRVLATLPGDEGDDGVERFAEGAARTAEELERLTLREDLPEPERVSLLLQSAYALQRLCGLSAVPALLSQQGQSAQTRENILSLFASAAAPTGPKASHEQQLVAAEAVSIMLSVSASVTPGQAAETLLPLAMRCVRAAADSDVLDSWGTVLLALFRSLPADALRPAEMLPFVARMADPQNAVAVRVLCCGAVARLAQCAPALAGGLAEQALTLAHDVDFVVRAAIAAAADALARALGPLAAKRVVLPALL